MFSFSFRNINHLLSSFKNKEEIEGSIQMFYTKILFLLLVLFRTCLIKCSVPILNYNENEKITIILT